MKEVVNSLVRELGKRKLTLALAESVTGGLAAHQLATCKGVSEVLVGSVVCYAPEMKTGLLGIPVKLIDKYTCESGEVTAAMAVGLSKLIKADVYAAITGLASEGGSETKEKPVGTIFFCVRHKNKVYKLTKRFRGTPLDIRKKACRELFILILSKV
jgi:nicotinamide-nucleotide amidase